MHRSPFTAEQIAQAVRKPSVQEQIAAVRLDLPERYDLGATVPMFVAELNLDDPDYADWVVEALENELDPELVLEPCVAPADYEGRTPQERVTLHLEALLCQTKVDDREEFEASQREAARDLAIQQKIDQARGK
jgi:hypothetical protein